MTDYYAILGLQKGASEDEIKKAYHRMARKYHPHIAGKSEENTAKMTELNNAYEILSDPQKRQMVDSGIDPNAVNSGFGEGFGYSSDVFGDIFDMFSGGRYSNASRSPRTRRSKGNDVGVKAKITLNQAVFGGEIIVKYNSQIACNICDGTGSKSKSDETTCRECDGDGVIGRVTNTMFGQIMQQTQCYVCYGYGTIIQDPCEKCSGEGIINEQVETSVKLPIGCRSGHQLRFEGKGGVGTLNGPKGNLIIEIEILDHEIFSISNNDLNCKLIIPVTTALLGGKYKLETLDDEITVEIEPGCPSGKVIAKKGLGLPKSIFSSGPIKPNHRGDLNIFIDVLMPQKLNKKQTELIKTLAHELNDESFVPKFENLEKGGFGNWFRKLFQ